MEHVIFKPGSERSWVDQVHARAALIHEQIALLKKVEAQDGIDVSGNIDLWRDKLASLYASEYALAGLLDSSDMVFHAEGPGAAHGHPSLASLNWLSSSVERQLKQLAAAMLDSLGADGRTLSKSLDLRLSGIAPGSLFLGVRYAPVPADLLPQDSEAMQAVASGAMALPSLVRYIEDEALDAGIREASPDPAILDAQLAALLKLAPTGTKGIHSLGMSSRINGEAIVGQRERVVLRDALSRPLDKAMKPGSFVGQVRETDLDRTRVTLRQVAGVGAIRCVLRDMSAADAKRLIGETVEVRGRYAADREGRPRLLYVESIHPSGQMALPAA